MTPPKTPAERAAERIVHYVRSNPSTFSGNIGKEKLSDIITAEYASIEQELEAFKANPQVGTCCMCGSAIWHKESRMTDERGTFHPICAIKQENQRLKEKAAVFEDGYDTWRQRHDKVAEENQRLREALGIIRGQALGSNDSDNRLHRAWVIALIDHELQALATDKRG